MGCRVDEKPVRKLENKSNNSNFGNWSNSCLRYGAEGVPRHRSLFERKHNINRTEFTCNFDLFWFFRLTRSHNAQGNEDFCSVASALEGNTTLKTLALNVTFFIHFTWIGTLWTKPKWQSFGMNCGALCKGLSNNNTLTNLTVFGADATGMIDILQLNATKKSLTSFSFSVCILFKFVNFDL